MKKLILIIGLLTLFLSGIHCQKEVSVSPDQPSVHKGVIYIGSNPTNAKIYLNDKNTGKVTPDSLRWLETGKYKLTLKLKNWSDSLFYVSVNEIRKDSLYIDFTKNVSMCGTLEIKTTPAGATILINSENSGKVTPAVISNLLPGRYNIGLLKERYWYDTVNVNIISRKTTTIQKVLADTAVWIVYNKFNSAIPSNSILSVAVDKNNIKWIGTSGEGLVSFDDKVWKVFNISNSPLPDNSVNVVYVDRFNNKWIGTLNYGLVKYDGVNWILYNVNNSGLPSNTIWGIAEDLNGDLWVATYNKGLAVFNGINWKVYNSSNTGLPIDYISAITIDKSGNKWIGTPANGIVKFDGINWSIYNSGNGWMPDIITALGTDDAGNIWAGITHFSNYTGGLYKFGEAKGWELFSSYFSDRISCIVNSENRLWIGSYDNGFGLIEGRFIYRDFYNGSNSPIQNNIVNSIVIDATGNKWIGTGSDGLMKFKFKN
jgi:ligand-binding sensor domain-containing protein